MLMTVVCLFTFSACNDDDEDDVSPNVSLLTGERWTGSAVFINGEDRTEEFEQEYEIDITQYTSQFERDGTYTDRYNGNVLVDGTWEYGNNERIIIFDKGTQDEYTVVISKLDEDELFYLQGGLEFRFTR
ncbi:hypothetical protein POKO110462_06970 [Pontibacter korlensis]|uniref:Lipocalin-like domain-containing protein n=2 Tax=Pontibacter korlensis TaxID=400092 RepID=A0A0E3ZI93_9BACT|nr:hypothetical protein PKOR_17205 [Pontibacter korlensis]